MVLAMRYRRGIVEGGLLNKTLTTAKQTMSSAMYTAKTLAGLPLKSSGEGGTVVFMMQDSSNNSDG